MAHKICCKTSSTPEWGWRAGNLENQDMPSMALVGCSCCDWLKNRAIVPKGCLRWLPWQPKEDGFQLSCDRKSWTVPVTFRSGPRPLGNIYGVVTVATGTCTQSCGLWSGQGVGSMSCEWWDEAESEPEQSKGMIQEWWHTGNQGLAGEECLRMGVIADSLLWDCLWGQWQDITLMCFKGMGHRSNNVTEEKESSKVPNSLQILP